MSDRVGAPTKAGSYFIVIVADDPLSFEDEINKALANGYNVYGEYHYDTWIDDSTGRVEQWSMALTREHLK